MNGARRVGRFSVDRLLVETAPEVVRQLMGMMIVVRCEMDFAMDRLEYTALSPHFAEVPIGNMIPGYDIIIREADDGIGLRTITFH